MRSPMSFRVSRVPGWVSDMLIYPRSTPLESVESDGTYVCRWTRQVGDTVFRFTRVENGNRNTYIDVVRLGDNMLLHTFMGRATGPLAGVQNISRALGKLIQF